MEVLAHFHEHGWARIPRALCPDTAAAMRAAAWQALGDAGIRRDAPSTWTVERPAHLQSLKEHPVFRDVSPHIVELSRNWTFYNSGLACSEHALGLGQGLPILRRRALGLQAVFQIIVKADWL